MADQKISQLTTKTTPVGADVLPIVDSSAGDNKKVTMATLPVSTPVQTAIDAKVADAINDGVTTIAPSQNAVFDALAGKQASLGFTPENVANKSTSVATDQASNTKYPSVKAVYDWAVGAFQAALGFTPENVANKSTSTSLGTSDTLYPSQKAAKTYIDTGLSGKQNTLGFTPEDVANKENTALDTSTTKYPSNNIVKTAVDAKANLLGGNTFTGRQDFSDGLVSRFTADVQEITSFPYTLQLSDNGKILRLNSSSSATVTLPNSLLAGFNIAWVQSGSGVITFSPASGATLTNRQTHTKSAGQYAMGSLVVMTNLGTNATYNLSGDTQA